MDGGQRVTSQHAGMAPAPSPDGERPPLAEPPGQAAPPAGSPPGSPQAGGAIRYLSIGLSDRRFAIPLDRVIGVVESTTLTPIPFSPSPFEGLVQAMGLVIPQISLAALLDLPHRAGGILVVVSDAGGSVALRVEHVYAMVQIDREKLLLASPGQRAAYPMVLGHFGEGRDACAVISMDDLTSGELAAMASEVGSVLLAPAHPRGGKDEAAREQQVEPYLMVSVSGHIYAVKISRVIELVELSTLRPVPQGPAWIAGMMELRGEPILGLSLSQLLAQPDQGPGRLGLLVGLTPTEGQAAAGRVALIAERSLGIERYAEDQIHAMREPVAGIESYLVRADDSITGVIDPEALLRPVAAELGSWVPRSQPVEAAAARAQPMEYRQLLTLRAGREMIAVPLDRIYRLQAAVQFTPIPMRGSGFDGLADVGDLVVPVIDLRRVLSDGAPSRPTSASAPNTGHPPGPPPLPPCLLAMIEGSVAGIVVDQVLRIETVAEDQLSPAENALNLPISETLNLQGRLMSVISLDRLLRPL
jgi:chemotaxis signal transduction protein